MSDRAVDGQCGTQANAHNHEADLVDHAVRQHPPKIVLDDGIEDRKARHDGPDVNQHLGSGETACQCIYRHFGRKGAQEDRTGRCGFRVGVRQPVMQKRESALDPEGDKNQHAARTG